jgi:hypothetical protein
VLATSRQLAIPAASAPFATWKGVPDSRRSEIPLPPTMQLREGWDFGAAMLIDAVFSNDGLTLC